MVAAGFFTGTGFAAAAGFRGVVRGAAGFFPATGALAAAAFRAGAAFFTAVVRAAEAALGVFAAAGFLAAAALLVTAIKSLLQMVPQRGHRVICNIKPELSQHSPQKPALPGRLRPHTGDQEYGGS
ncbi:hypothetical protein ACFLR7_06155 [Acidobacteriota bacterium]